MYPHAAEPQPPYNQAVGAAACCLTELEVYTHQAADWRTLSTSYTLCSAPQENW